MDIPTWKWEVINMNFITRLPRTHRQHDSIWVIVYKMTKSSRFLANRTTDSTEDYDKVYINEMILKRVGKVAYELKMPAKLAVVHPVFHISLLKKWLVDPTFVVPLESATVKDSLSYEDVPVGILDRHVRRLKNKKVLPVKV
ncbi:hypothetical protein EJD97_006250 [Solanum chilense]|uniref:Tf2-1-like SH3-like domain-containing protein n=1 Tax=Solanum chilense TaxID=4083 RepID=A0A6N2CCS3_SOLCI|nr:hypothetical protein EJD97_006250 [Solanum chilense]